MTDTKQPEALRLAEVIEDYVECTEFDSEQAAAELRRQYAEIEALQDDLAHKDDYAEQLGRELAKADSEAKELRAKLDELEKQEPLAFVLQSTADGSIFKSVVAMVGWSSFKRDLNALETDPWVKAGRAKIIPLYLAAGARPVEPAPAAQDDSKRLDFLDENLQMKMGWSVGKAPAGNVSVWSLIQPAGATSIRVAIDAARAADKKEPT